MRSHEPVTDWWALALLVNIDPTCTVIISLYQTLPHFFLCSSPRFGAQLVSEISVNMFFPSLISS